MSLSRLWQHQGKKSEARQIFFHSYNWFTEGLDTKDLQEAKALLEQEAEALCGQRYERRWAGLGYRGRT